MSWPCCKWSGVCNKIIESGEDQIKDVAVVVGRVDAKEEDGLEQHKDEDNCSRWVISIKKRKMRRFLGSKHWWCELRQQ